MLCTRVSAERCWPEERGGRGGGPLGQHARQGAVVEGDGRRSRWQRVATNVSRILTARARRSRARAASTLGDAALDHLVGEGRVPRRARGAVLQARRAAVALASAESSKQRARCRDWRSSCRIAAERPAAVGTVLGEGPSLTSPSTRSPGPTNERTLRLLLSIVGSGGDRGSRDRRPLRTLFDPSMAEPARGHASKATGSGVSETAAPCATSPPAWQGRPRRPVHKLARLHGASRAPSLQVCHHLNLVNEAIGEATGEYHGGEEPLRKLEARRAPEVCTVDVRRHRLAVQLRDVVELERVEVLLVRRANLARKPHEASVSKRARASEIVRSKCSARRTARAMQRLERLAHPL